MEKDMLIKKATDEDLDYIYNNYSNYDDFWNPDIFKNSNGDFFIIIFSNLIVGYINIVDSIDVYEILNICIDKNYRNKHFGSKLLEYVLKIYNAKDIFLEVSDINVNAICLYKKFGFVKISIRKNYYKNADAIIMKRSKV